MRRRVGIMLMFLIVMAVGFFSQTLYVLADDGDAPVTFDSLVHVTFHDPQGNPITTPLDLRVSLWNDSYVRNGDIDGSGNINTAALHYGGYQGTTSIAPDEYGKFRNSLLDGQFVLGARDLENFPTSIGFQNAFLQLEFKHPGEPDTSYVMYDFVDDPPNNNITRSSLLQALGYTTADAGPGTNSNTFILDRNNNASTAVILQFGETLAKTLSYNKTSNSFELNDSLFIDGGLSATGTINFSTANVGIGTASPQSALHVADGYYAQFEDNNPGPPPAGDCRLDAQRGRLSIDTSDNRLYICNGALRGWDYVPLTD